MIAPEEISQELILACSGGVYDHVAFLLNQYDGIIDLEYQEPEYGITALIQAIDVGCIEIVHLLLKSGANVNSTNGDEQTPLIIAASNDYLDIVELLLEYGADVNQVDLGNWTALHYAIFYRNPFIAEILVAFDTDLSISDPESKRTILMEAIITKDQILIEFLLSQGVDVNCLDSKQQSALDYAVRYCPFMLPMLLYLSNIEDSSKWEYYWQVYSTENIPTHRVM